MLIIDQMVEAVKELVALHKVQEIIAKRQKAKGAKNGDNQKQ